MKLTQKLLGFLNRVFDKTSGQFLALIFRYAGSDMAWTVEDGVLTVTVSNDGPGTGFVVDLTQYTLQSLAAFIAGQKGYTVSFLTNSGAGLSAAVLLDASGDQNRSNGDHLFAYSSLLWSYLEAQAAELDTASDQIVEAVQQINVFNADGSPGAGGFWLDQLGAQFGDITRIPNESDEQYGPRIIATILRPKGNNIALEVAIQAFTGQVSTVTDVVLDGFTEPLYDNSLLYDGSHTHNSTGTHFYGLFDVNYAYDLINGGDITGFEQVIADLIDQLRDAGTHLRALNLQSSSIGDDFTSPPTDASSGYSVVGTLADSFTAAPTEVNTSNLGIVTAIIFETLTAPDDSTDDLLVAYDVVYSGQRFFNGAVGHNGGEIEDSNIAGTVINYDEPIGEADFSIPEGGALLVALGA